MSTRVSTPAKRFFIMPGGALKRLSGKPGMTRNGAGRDLVGLFSHRSDRRDDRHDAMEARLRRRTQRDRAALEMMRDQDYVEEVSHYMDVEDALPDTVTVGDCRDQVRCFVGRAQVGQRLREIRAMFANK